MDTFQEPIFVQPDSNDSAFRFHVHLTLALRSVLLRLDHVDSDADHRIRPALMASAPHTMVATIRRIYYVK
jgi:hypothetical protein